MRVLTNSAILAAGTAPKPAFGRRWRRERLRASPSCTADIARNRFTEGVILPDPVPPSDDGGPDGVPGDIVADVTEIRPHLAVAERDVGIRLGNALLRDQQRVRDGVQPRLSGRHRWGKMTPDVAPMTRGRPGDGKAERRRAAGSPRSAGTPVAPAGPAPPAAGIWWRAGLIVAAGALAYRNSLSGPFILDDAAAIAGNRTIRQLWHLASVLFPERDSAVAGRPLVNLSLAINYAIGGLDVRGYHVWNVAMHLLCALALFGVVRRVLESPRLKANTAIPVPQSRLRGLAHLDAASAATAKWSTT